MPEVKAVLAQYFNSRPIKQQNVSEWKLGGYRDWLHHRQILEQQRELAADAKDLSDVAKGMADSLHGILTLNYADLIMNGDKETPEEFEKKRKELSLVSQDISRMHRCHINTRRVEVQEARLERDEEKTEEQLHFKFMEWTENPAIRRALILEPMEANRQTRQKFGMPPTSDDILVEKLTRNDPWFNPPSKKQNKYKPKPAENSNPETRSSSPPASEKASESNNDVNHPTATPSPGGEGRGEGELNTEQVGRGTLWPPSSSSSASEKSPALDYAGKTTSEIIAEIEGKNLREKAARLNPTASEKTPASNNNTNRPTASPSPLGEGRGEGGLNSKLKTQNSTLPKPPLSDYERALREGKTHLEALYIHQAPESAKADSPRHSPARRDEDGSTKPNTQPTPPQGTSAWDSFSQPVRPSPYAWASHHATSGFQLRYG
jgi:hypothetical protein